MVPVRAMATDPAPIAADGTADLRLNVPLVFTKAMPLDPVGPLHDVAKLPAFDDGEVLALLAMAYRLSSVLIRPTDVL